MKYKHIKRIDPWVDNLTEFKSANEGFKFIIMLCYFYSLKFDALTPYLQSAMK